TEGLGAGAQPDVGRAGAEESLDEILEQLSGSRMVFITAGMGGGTGTGAAPVIARAVREQGILTVGVVTKPFAFEGDKRMRMAERGISELQNYVHTLIVIPNQNLFRIANDRTTFAQAFTMADEVLHCGVRGVTDLIVMPGLINLDFADIKSVISEMGKAMMGTGEAEGEDRAIRAADAAICNPLLEDVSMKGARGVLINITGGPDLMLFEVEQAANRVRAEVDPDANIIFGNTILDNMEGRIRVSVVATGIEAEEMRKLPENVERLRAVSRSVPPPAIAPGRPAVNPVHRQVENIAEQMDAMPPPPAPSQIETMILSGQEEAEAAEPLPEIVVARAPVAPPPQIQPQPRYEAPRPVAQEAERRSAGLFGGWRKKAPERTEPAPAPRATVQPMARAPEPVRPVSQNMADDLFPEQKRDDQFEIPAFLRRQTN
ncbi:MAG TPA: cell division protein FtsZ, partial [Rhizomicrobium sp.]|nr:cell division protein FtsZ [Rhizomicrobium sp.]